MKNLHTLTYSHKKISLPILSELKMHIEITENPFELEVQELFQMAARINKKRSFLFVSKLLGKHIPIKPKLGLWTGFALAARYEELKTGVVSASRDVLLKAYYDNIASFRDEPIIAKEIASPIIIGFAETATALGHSFYKAFSHAAFFHTTREVVDGMESIISFEEEHSHATSHRCYIDASMLDTQREVILVDDELTTGNTAINIIRDIQAKYPRTEYTVVSILDWRSKENEAKLKSLEQELGITIRCVSLIKGVFQLEGELNNVSDGQEETGISTNIVETEYISLAEFTKDNLLPFSSRTLLDERNVSPYLKNTGRFGLHSSEIDWVEAAASFLAQKRIGSQTLSIGTGEFMYIPMKIASLMGDGVYYQSSTRSPIYPHNEHYYGAKTAIHFLNPEDTSIDHYLYNLTEYAYDDIFVFFERKLDEAKLNPLLDKLKGTGARKINIVYAAGGK
ncbi:phosphoribosyltransferase family protein [Niallia circulans]|uniref:phosphoribosyltransferase family protein n=1 Tax=Niallia circulans TaxID=1397 RepID=UPI001F270856|nr:phosphoribosyltransferase family protein [Niallia circulans]